MRASLIAAAVVAPMLTAPAFAVTAPRASGITDGGGGAIVNVGRRRVCEWRRGNKVCWWVGHRDWDDRRGGSWRRDHWRKGYFFDGPGVSVRIR